MHENARKCTVLKMRAAGARAERQWERLGLFEVETGVGLGSVWDQKGSERDRFGTALGPGFLSRSWRELAEARAGPGVGWRGVGQNIFFDVTRLAFVFIWN